MKVEIKIEYWWNTDDYVISSEQKKLLKESAENRIHEQRSEGMFEGELHYEDDEMSVWGWWKSKSTEL